MVHQSAAMPLTSGQVSFTSAPSRADRACLERAGRSQPANGRLRDGVGAGQLGLHCALREALHGLTALMGCERRRATEAYALRLRAVAAGAGSGEDRSLAAHCTSYLLIMTLGVTAGSKSCGATVCFSVLSFDWKHGRNLMSRLVG